MKKPNILFIMTDQQRWDAMSCSGDWVKTPNIDRIANEGVRFENCVTTTPVCIPARLTMATGLYPHNHNIWNNKEFRCGEHAKTWMQCVRDAGYRTSLFGKSHLHPHGLLDLRDEEPLMSALGVDDVNEIGGPRASRRVKSYMTEMWEEKDKLQLYRDDMSDRYENNPTVVRPSVLGLDDYADTYVGDQARAYLENYSDEKPWFCWLSFGGPHEPWDTPEPYASLYNPNEMPKAQHREHMAEQMPARYLKKTLDNDDDAEHIAKMRADYAGNITLIDEQIGRVLDLLEARGELENTIITFTSDHGEMNGDFGLVYKSVFMNGAVRVPMLVRTPETAKNGGGKVCSSPCEWSDLGPTLVELVGGKIEHEQYAKSMCASVDNPAHEYRDSALSEEYEEIMILTKSWKLMVDKDKKPYALFDQIHDKAEHSNLVHSAEHQDTINELLAQLQTRLDNENLQVNLQTA